MNTKWMIGCCFFAAHFASSASAEMNVLALSGSTRSDSHNKKLLLEAVEIARQMGAHVTLFDLKQHSLPFYDGDLESVGAPENANRLRELMASSDAILIASPEYNGSFSAVLKNAIDWATRKKGSPTKEAFQGKRFALMSTSPGRGGGAKALSQLRAVIEHIGGTVVSGEVSVPQAHAAFDSKGVLQSDPSKQQLKELIRQTLSRL